MKPQCNNYRRLPLFRAAKQRDVHAKAIYFYRATGLGGWKSVCCLL